RYGRQLNRRVEFEIFGKNVDFESSYTTYIVRPKTTLYSLARSFDMTIDELIKINGLTSNDINAYSPIRVNKTVKVDYGLVFQGSASPKGYQQYSVREGETIYSVAERFQIPEELLMEINGLRNPNLKPGQLLNIYIQ
ncbi:MAG: LysM peptidoglycan-binding domain-containing protein, partial [Bacteroidetes bacterium]|nr:LysM peptidoglycan-binding domain-containing protein [Bacteroidota bacterium]